MNEKFNELSALAQEKLIDPITGEEYYSFSRMKFAELIVRECGAIALNIGCGDIEDELLKHFGVEE